MKTFLFLFVLIIANSRCSNIKVTASPDQSTTTSGTLGSAKMTNQLPQQPDTTRRLDTLKIIRDTLPKKRQQ
jgi:hypothetical protein